jgi:uncharacterized membrane protein
MANDIALKLLQLVALTIPPIAVLIQMLRRSENLEWRMRKWSFGLAITSVVAFIGTGITVLVYLLRSANIPALLGVGIALAVVGLVPFALFTGILYQEHKAQFGP